MAEEPVRWGFLGAGSIARDALGPAVHAASGAVLHAAAARDPDRARSLGAAIVHPTYDDLVADESVEAVYVALYNVAHAPWVIAALAAGKHVLCEKPLGLSVRQVDAMTAAAAGAGRLLVEAAWNRWHPRTREFERLLDAGAVGRVRQVVSRFCGGPPAHGDYRYDPALGGGALYDVGCYAVAAALSAVGWQLPVEVAAAARRWPSGADSRTEATLTFPGGGVAEIVAGLDGEADERVEVTGADGRLQLTEQAFTARTAPATLRIETAAGADEQTWPATNPYVLMVHEVSRGVRGELATVVPPSQSTAVAATLDQIRTAAGLPPVAGTGVPGQS